MGTMITGPAAVPAEWTELLRRSAQPRTGLHVTDCLGCPRRLALLKEGAEPDLSRLEARLSGTLLHAGLSDVDAFHAEVPVYGRLFGLDLVGSVDRIEWDGGKVFTTDYKSSDNSKMPDAPYPDQVIQQEIYRRLLADMPEWEHLSMIPDPPRNRARYLVERGSTDGFRIYFRRAGQWGRYEHIGPVWSESELAAFRPHDGAFTTAEIAGQCVSGKKAAELPLVGATQRIGAGTACSYCEVGGPCGQAGSEVEL